MPGCSCDASCNKEQQNKGSKEEKRKMDEFLEEDTNSLNAFSHVFFLRRTDVNNTFINNLVLPENNN